MVRVLTFACVIAVHTVSTVNPLDSVPAGSVVMLLHFTREAFFVLTAFVLMHRYAAAGPAVLPFWRRRFLLVGVPYVVWTVIYTGLQQVPVPVSDPVATLVRNLLTGTGWFHLYFLLVSLQFYLVFPAFRWLLRATRGHHAWLLAASAALQVALDVVLHGLDSPYAGSVFVSYPFFLVLGGVVAMHRDRVDAWIRTHTRAVVAAFVVTGVAAEGWYQLTVPAVGAIVATDVFQPVMIPWVVAVCALFWAAGAAWRPQWVGRASDRSFGVFLVHPAILWALTVGGTVQLIPAPWSSVAAYAVAVGGSLLVVEGLRRTPLSLVLTGKSRARSMT
jgi:peptidoglycan/LPS O-acetylase OafA/YrhL